MIVTICGWCGGHVGNSGVCERSCELLEDRVARALPALELQLQEVETCPTIFNEELSS